MLFQPSSFASFPFRLTYWSLGIVHLCQDHKVAFTSFNFSCSSASFIYWWPPDKIHLFRFLWNSLKSEVKVKGFYAHLISADTTWKFVWIQQSMRFQGCVFGKVVSKSSKQIEAFTPHRFRLEIVSLFFHCKTPTHSQYELLLHWSVDNTHWSHLQRLWNLEYSEKLAWISKLLSCLIRLLNQKWVPKFATIQVVCILRLPLSGSQR